MTHFWNTLSRIDLLAVIALSTLAGGGACGGESATDSSATAGSAGSAGTTSSGGNSAGTTSSSGSGGLSPDNTCPASAPPPGSPCPRVALHCAYGDDHVDYLCTTELTWRERTYAPASAAGGAAGAANAGGSAGEIVQPPAVDCGAVSECTGQCAFGCCAGGGDDTAGCAGCCQMLSCGLIPADQCPAGVCQLMQGCDGKQLCGPLFADAPPACGVVSYYGQEVACCAGLSLRCGGIADGTCDAAAGGYSIGLGSVPQCLDCGDGTCETPFENNCNCAEDCPQ